MQNNIILTENGINILLNQTNISVEVDTNMYFQLKDFKSLNEQLHLYICNLRDSYTEYDKFILKSSKQLVINNIIHVIKIRITSIEGNKYINCLHYENLDIDQYLNRLAQKEKERIEEEELNKILEETLKSYEKEEVKRAFFNDDLNKQTKLALSHLPYTSSRPRYRFKLEEGNLKWLNFSGKTIVSPNKEEEKENELDFDIFSDDNDNKDNENKIKIEEEKSDLNKIEIEEDEKENEEKKEIEDIFKGININEFFDYKKKSQKSNKKLKQEFEHIVNLSTKNNRKPLYVKCIKKIILTKKQNRKTLFCIFRDSDGAEITSYTYTNNHIENLDKKILLNGVYIISGYTVHNLISTSYISNNYYLLLNSYSKIQQMPDDIIFNKINFHFLTIEELFYFRENCIVDICGIIYDEGEPRIYNMKNGQKYMRNVLIADSSMKKIIISLYEPHSKDIRIKFEKGEILAIKYGKIGFSSSKIKKINTCNFTILRNSTENFEQDRLLRDFYRKNPTLDNFVFLFSSNDFKYLKDIKDQMHYNTEHNIDKYKSTFTTKAYIYDFILNENSIYKGCPSCSKKLSELKEQNKFGCLPCNKMYNEPKYTFILIIRVRDANDNAYFKLIGTKANKILGIEPEQLKQLLDAKRFRDIESLEKKILFHEYIFTVTLTSYINKRTGKICHNININNMEKAEGENLKRILQLFGEEDGSS